MSKLQFRLLIIAVLFFGLLGGTIDLVIPSGDAEIISNYAATINAGNEDTSIFVLIASAVPLLVCIIGSVIGLFLLKWWGRTLFLSSFLVSLPLYFLTGTSVVSPCAEIFMILERMAKASF